MRRCGRSGFRERRLTDAVGRLTSALAERYRIDRRLGEGGMATVYLAHDLRHGRDVAIKVLHPDLAAALGGERFLSEIKTTARLQHPHILPLLDSGDAGGLLYYVMPVATGETLRARLTRERQLPIDDALRIAREVADALAHAHESGIIHRDIKPENILLQGGHALVADFGIALAVQSAGGERMTQTGLSLGTPQYMSPEQAMGERGIDARSDIYALGAVTYEMLAGDPPFTGSSVQAIVAKVLSEKPTPLATLRDTVPPSVQHAVVKALSKLPADRFASATEFARALTLEHHTAPSVVAPGRERALSRSRMTSGVLALMTVLAVAIAAWGLTRGAPAAAEGPVSRLEFTTTGELRFAYPHFGMLTALAISPDGERAVFTAERGEGWALAIRNLDQLTARLLPGTEGATWPAFSPDGRWIAFSNIDGTIRKIAADGSALTILCEVGVPGASGLTWLSNEEIAFSRGSLVDRGMFHVSAGGGTPVQLSRPDSSTGELFQLAPKAIDGGRLVIYSSSKSGIGEITLGVFRTSDGTGRVFPGIRSSMTLGLVDGSLVYVRPDGALMAVPFDVRTLEAGSPIQVGDSVAVQTWVAVAALATNGSLLYQQGGAAGQLVRVDAQGVASPLADSVRRYGHPRYSPRGDQLAFEVVGTGGVDVWTMDLESGGLQRLTSDGVSDRPEWSIDGTSILYPSARDSQYTLWSHPVDGSGGATNVLTESIPIREGLYTPDGRAIIYRVDARETNRDVWMLPLGGERKRIPLLNSIHDEKEPRVSPDGRWLAYVSNETGREEVFVRPLAAGSGRVSVSAEAAGEPLWAPDGKRLYYRAGTRLMEAIVTGTPSLGVSARRVVFTGPYASDIFHPNYDVAPDGRSFVMIRPAQDHRRIVMVVNWAKELRRRMGTAR